MSSRTIWRASSNKRPGLPKEAQRFLLQEGFFQAEIFSLKGDGSERGFFRVRKGKQTLVLILPQEGERGLAEARAYVRLGLFLDQHGLPVPKILAFEEKHGFILVEDLGDTRLEDLPRKRRLAFYPQAIELLVRLQGLGKEFDPRWAFEEAFYDEKTMWQREALYFVESFLKNFLGLTPPSEILEELWELFLKARFYLGEEVLLHRDFQSRNLMVQNQRLRLIDFQGTRLGPPHYDLASLLFDPYANLKDRERKELFDLYLTLSSRRELAGFYHLAVFRLLQAIGAFAKLSLSGKGWFRRYLPVALSTLKDLLQEHFPETKALTDLLARVEKEFCFAMV